MELDELDIDGQIERVALWMHHTKRRRSWRALTVPAGTGITLNYGPACILVGWSLVETTGAASAAVQIINGDTAAGPLVGVQNLAQGASFSFATSDDGILCDAGPLVNVVSGSVQGALYIVQL